MKKHSPPLLTTKRSDERVLLLGRADEHPPEPAAGTRSIATLA
jgi:hypothetical protein